MADVRPVKAIRYDPARIGDLGAVVAPPYDVISTDTVERLYARSPYNAVRLILNRDPEPHTAAARAFRAWRDEKVLIQDDRPALYFYSQTFEIERVSLRRDGIIGVMRLEDFGSGQIYPHELTHERPKIGRLRLVEACRANLSPIFGLISRADLILHELVGPALTQAPTVDLIVH